MIAATTWRDLRWRLLVALLLLAPTVALILSGSIPRGSGAPANRPDAYLAYLDAAWYRVPGASAVLLPVAVILAAAGPLVRPAGDVAYLLSLPPSRGRWLLGHLAAALGTLAALIALTGVAFAVVARRAGTSLPAEPFLVRSLGLFLAASVWSCVTLGVLAAARRAVLAIVIVLGLVVVLPGGRFELSIPPRAAPASVSAWDPWEFADPRSWGAGPPLPSIAVATLLAVGGVALAWRAFDRYEP